MQPAPWGSGVLKSARAPQGTSMGLSAAEDGDRGTGLEKRFPKGRFRFRFAFALPVLLGFLSTNGELNEMKTAETAEKPTIRTRELAELLGTSERRIQQRVAMEDWPKVSHGTFDLAELCRFVFRQWQLQLE